MNTGQIPSHIRRFVLTSINSVLHLEALILLKTDPSSGWDARRMAQSLYLSEKKTDDLLKDLTKAGFLLLKEDRYFYQPSSAKLKELVRELANIYPRYLIEISNLIHSNVSRQAQKFGDAFKFQGEKEKNG